VQLYVKSVLVRSDRSSRVTYASSPANALDEGPVLVDNAQLPPTGACKFVLISVPNPFEWIRKLVTFGIEKVCPAHRKSSIIYASCTSLTCSTVGLSVF
jgi:hypothetical protein